MNCSQAQLLLQDLIDGRLGRDPRRLVEQHLRVCQACARELRLYEQVHEALATEGLPRVDLADAIMRRVPAAAPARRPLRTWAYAAVCVCVAAGVALVMPLRVPRMTLPEPLAALLPQVTGAQIEATGVEWNAAAQGLVAQCVAAAAQAWQEMLAGMTGRPTLPQVPLLVVVAICLLAAAANAYCLRRPLAEAHRTA